MDKENNKEPEARPEPEEGVEAEVKEKQEEKISSKEEEKPKKKMIIVWQCLNPECTNSNKRSLR